MYRLNDRNEFAEMKARYEAMVNIFSDILNCGRYEIEELFDSETNIEVGDIVKRYVEETGVLPDRNTVYIEALFDFSSEHDIEIGKDIDIYANGCLDTHIYLKEDLMEDFKNDLEYIFGIDVKVL